MAQPITWQILNATFEELKTTLNNSSTAQTAFTDGLKERIPQIGQSISELGGLITRLQQVANRSVDIQSELDTANANKAELKNRLDDNNSQIQQLYTKIQETLQQVADNTGRYGQNQGDVNNLINALQQTVTGIVTSIQQPNQAGGKKRVSKKMNNKSKNKSKSKSKNKNKNKRKTMKNTKKSYKKKGGWSYSKRRLRGGILIL